MDSTAFQTLSTRVDALEASNRRLRRSLALAGLTIASLAMIATRGGQPPRQIEAEQFVVKDAAGRVRASLSMLDGEPALSLRDERGEEQIMLRSNQDHSSSLEFLRHGRLNLMLTSASNGDSVLQLFGERHSPAVGLYSWRNGAAGLALNHNHAGVHLGVEPTGTAHMRYADSTGRVVGGWSLDADGKLGPLASSHAPVRNASTTTPRISTPTVRTSLPERPVFDPLSQKDHNPAACETLSSSD